LLLRQRGWRRHFEPSKAIFRISKNLPNGPNRALCYPDRSIARRPGIDRGLTLECHGPTRNNGRQWGTERPYKGPINKSPALGAGGAWSLGNFNPLSVSAWCGPFVSD